MIPGTTAPGPSKGWGYPISMLLLATELHVSATESQLMARSYCATRSSNALSTLLLLIQCCVITPFINEETEAEWLNMWLTLNHWMN